ncbi:Interferon regulatory factor 8 [Chionoecetes opilio]|uniref:Interferon regulatory factor 8 n=1 Tax=Chionoecetes opilio TaxID=41210 RepID=A0A8J5CE53_CHIOP|nr:Interferon regulatory factor 8 [Chionoecetes opilio]
MPTTALTIDAPMDLSTKTRRKLRLEEFLRQNLDQAPATRVIQWVDREQGVFKILWTHQSSGAFTQQDAALFRYWALARGKPPNLSSVELKQSLRMALNKSPSVDRLTGANDEYRYFRFTGESIALGKPSQGRLWDEDCEGQQDSARKISPPPGHPPPLTPIAKITPPSPPLWSHNDHLALLTRGEKSFAPYSEEILRGLLDARSRASQYSRENQHETQQLDSRRGHSHLIEHSVLDYMSPAHLTPKDRLAEDTTHGFGLMRGPYMEPALTLDYRVREKVLREPAVSNHLLAEHMRYLPKAHSPQAYSESLHAVPSYRESLARPDLEGPLSLYSDNPYYPKSYSHSDYRSACRTAAAHLYSVPDQALAAPHDTLQSRLLSMHH